MPQNKNISHHNILRDIPQVEKILQIDEINTFVPIIGHGIIVKIIRDEIKLFRDKVKNGQSPEIEVLISSIITKCKRKKLEKL